MTKTHRKKIKSNKTRKVGGVIKKNNPNKRVSATSGFQGLHKLSRLLRRKLSRKPTTTNLQHLLVTQPNIKLLYVVDTSVYSRVLLIETELGNIILKICIITPESEQLITMASSGVNKRTVSESDFEKEYKYLLANSEVGICPEPYFMDIYKYNPQQLPPILNIIQQCLKEGVRLERAVDKKITKALHQTFIDMSRLNKKGIRVQYGIIGMDYIDGKTLYERRYSLKPSNRSQICILLLLLHMNGYANYDCNARNILIRQDGVAFMVDFGECYLRKDGLDAPVGNTFDENTTDDNIIDFYISKLGDLSFHSDGSEDEREFLRNFITRNDIFTFDEISGHLRLALYCIYLSSPYYVWMKEYGFLGVINHDIFITSLQRDLRERVYGRIITLPMGHE
jgi:hypothetical protein